jgi:hypothetical protein
MQVIVHILKAYKENNIKKDKNSTKIHEYILSLSDFIWDKPWFNVFTGTKLSYWWSMWIYEKQISNR